MYRAPDIKGIPMYTCCFPHKKACVPHTTASDSNSSIACLAVAVVSVIQEQLLRCLWTQRSFLPGACHRLTQGWCVSFLWDLREGVLPRNYGSSTHHTHTDSTPIANPSTETAKPCMHFKLTG